MNTLIETSLGELLCPDIAGFITASMQCDDTEVPSRDYGKLTEMFSVLPLPNRRAAAQTIIEEAMVRWQPFEDGLAAKLLSQARMVAYVPYGEDPSEWVNFSEVSRVEFDLEVEYGSRFLTGHYNSPKLVEDETKIDGDVSNFESWKIQVDEIAVVMRNYRAQNADKK